MKGILGPFLLCGFLLAGCGKPTAEEYFTRAQEAFDEAKAVADTMRTVEDRAKMFAGPIAAYAMVVKEYPSSDFADSAQFMIATIRSNETHEAAMAVDAYKEYISRYPEGHQAPLCMFLIGYLYNNELHNIDSAGAAYRRFLEKYPEHEMAMSAQFELNTLGKSADQLLEQRMPKEEAPAPPTAARKGKQTVRGAARSTTL